MKHSIKLRRRRPVDSTLSEDLPPILRRLYSQRGVVCGEEIARETKHLLPWQGMGAIDQAVALLHRALDRQQRIMIVGDFDVDGATSTALVVLALSAMGANNIDYLVPNRFMDGYGLSADVVAQAAERGAEVIVTVDNGIAAHQGVEAARARGITVIVTDHHLPGETLPPADAIVNPNLRDSTFTSGALAGVGVAFYLMMALRAYLRTSGWFTASQTAPNLANLLDLVALGTVADVVPLDANNRILVWQGLRRIRAGHCRPGIQALLAIAQRDPRYLTANDLAFSLGPRLNAAGRLDNMSIGVALLLTEDKAEALALANELDGLNRARKTIEQAMQHEALQLCHTLQQQDVQADLPLGLVFYHPEWHQGVIGILASRLKERFHRPVIAFAPAGDGVLKGSGRSVAGLHLRDVLERLNTLHPALMLNFGGHAMAAGLTLRTTQLETFRQHFALLVSGLLDRTLLTGEVVTDGELTPEAFTLDTAEILRDGGPWGQDFPEPLFDGRFNVVEQHLVAGKHLKLRLVAHGGGPLLNAIAFNIDIAQWPDPRRSDVVAVYRMDINRYRGSCDLQLIIEHLLPCHSLDDIAS